MILKKIYNENTKTQRVWYDSSMIAYTEMVEDEFENKGDLYVTFKNGTTYIYKDVLFEDYILFIGGGTDASQGKTLNKVIKGKYEFVKGENKSIQELFEEMDRIIISENNEKTNIGKTYFISGHRDITETEFEINYVPQIIKALDECNDALFVVGDYNGVDIMAQNYLLDIVGIEPERITVYHMFDEPRNCNPRIVNLKGGFQSDEERDNAMTNNSSIDIAFVRDNKIISGTGSNILRRYKLISI